MPGGANWNYPTTSRNYNTEVLPDIKTRDEDAITLLGGTAPTNLPVGAIKYNRATSEIQEWDGANFNNRIFAITSGGTGASDATNARTNLGIGSLGTQNSNAINVTGGSISNLTTLGVSGNATISGTLTVSSTAANAITVGGGLRAGTGNVNIIGTDGRIPALTSTYIADLSAISSAIPSGAIIMFDVACPAGFTRYVALDGKFPRGNSVAGGTGGASSYVSDSQGSHTHSMSGSTGSTGIDHFHNVYGSTGDDSGLGWLAQLGGAPTTNVSAHTHQHDININTSSPSATDHTHSAGSLTANSAGAHTHTTSVTPPYYDVVWCKKN